jgi:hypothetical protein
MPDTPSTINVRPPVWALIFAVIIGGCFYLYGKNMEINAPSNSPFLVSVSADAKIAAPPDIATVDFGVTSGRESTAKNAMEKIKTSMTKIIAAVKQAGVEDKDIVTQSFYLNPVYDYVSGSQIPRGFEASQTLEIKIRDLDKAGDVITAATSAGANQAGDFSFSIDNPDQLKAQARALAVEKAKAKAKVLADNLGMQLVKITNFNEDNFLPMAYDMKQRSVNLNMGGAVAAPSTPLPVPSGQQEITSTVTLTYELR